MKDDIRIGVENALHPAATAVREAAYNIGAEWLRPSVVFRPSLSLDGNAWCALLGANIQDGLAAFGDSPDAAMRAFDAAWYEKQK